MWSKSELETQSPKEFYRQLYGTDLSQLGLKRSFNCGFHPIDPCIASQTTFSNDSHQLQLYYEVMKLPSVHSLLVAHSEIKLLDIGCGSGGGLRYLHEMFDNITAVGIDSNKESIQLANQYKSHKNPVFLEGNVEDKLPFQNGFFEIILSIQTISCLRNIKNAMLEMSRVLKKGGLIIICDEIQSGHDDMLVVLNQTEMYTFDRLLQRDISRNVALSCKLGSHKMDSLISNHSPTSFHSLLRNFFMLKKTLPYERLRLGEIRYYMECFKNIETYQEIPRNYIVPDKDADHPNFYDYREIFPYAHILQENYDVIYAEMQAVALSNWSPWPEEHYKGKDNDWRVFPFCYTFPAYVEENLKWINSTCSKCPKTKTILKDIPNIRTALFSRLGPKTTLTPHRGWADLSNFILRLHLGIVVPESPNSEPLCGMSVGGEIRYHKNGEMLVFDDSKVHMAFNNSDEERVVLIIDILRPPHIPSGCATGGHTRELDEFIATFS